MEKHCSISVMCVCTDRNESRSGNEMCVFVAEEICNVQMQSTASAAALSCLEFKLVLGCCFKVCKL